MDSEELSDVSFLPTPISKPVGGQKSSKTVDLSSTAGRLPLAPRIPLGGLSQGQAQSRPLPGHGFQQYGDKVSTSTTLHAARETTPKTLRQLEAYNAELERLTNSPATSAALAAPTPITAWGLSRQQTNIEGALDRRENGDNEKHQLSPVNELHIDEEVYVEEIALAEDEEHLPLLLNGGITGSNWEGMQNLQDHQYYHNDLVEQVSADKHENEPLSDDKQIPNNENVNDNGAYLHGTRTVISIKHTVEELLEHETINPPTDAVIEEGQSDETS
jgi:hypothetical protein